MKTDFIVIGSGLAGLTSSLILSGCGKVLLVTKGKLSDGATNWAQGGIACVVEEEDSWRKHVQDTLIAGAYHNDKKAVEFLVKNASHAIDWLAKQGVPFEKVKGKYKTGREGGHSYNRIIHATDFTGKVIEMTLVREVKKNKNIKIKKFTFASKLLVNNGRCFGVKVIKNRKIIDCYGQAIVLASGGLGQIYQWTTNPFVATGDGIALAYEAGAKLKDMEFIQFHPSALKDGKSPLFLLSEAMRGEGAWLVRTKNKEQRTKNKRAKRFMGEYDERMELAPRDIVARAIFAEQKKGYEVYLDIRHREKKFLINRFPNIYKKLKSIGLNLDSDLIPVTPAAHYSCGGVEVDLYGRTNIQNLLAFGEVACTGVHGANRLASNSLLESVVFPLRLKDGISGSSIFENPFFDPGSSSRSNDSGSLPKKSSRQVYLEQGREARTIKKNLQQLMWERVGIVRTKKSLEEALGRIKRWEKELEDFDYPSRESLEVKNMILAGKLITEAALKRKKSLGAHFIANSKPTNYQL